VKVDRWPRIEQLYGDTVARPPQERHAFLAEACQNDDELMSDVEALLALETSCAAPGLPIPTGDNGGLGALRDPIDDLAFRKGLLEPPKEPGRTEALTSLIQLGKPLPFWARVIIAATLIPTGVVLGVYLSGQTDLRNLAVMPSWLYAALSIAFTAMGSALVVGNRKDLRAAWLGGAFILNGLQQAAPLARMSSRLSWLANIRLDAFYGAFIWNFVAHFPSDAVGRQLRAIKVASAVTGLVGLWLASVNIAVVFFPPEWTSSGLPFVPTAMSRDIYWIVTYTITLAALVVLAGRALYATDADRFRVWIFIGGLLAGIAPFIVEVLAEELSPRYYALVHSPNVEPYVGWTLFGLRALVPVVTSYSVLFDRVVDMRVVLRTAAQYGLARYLILSSVLVPSGALSVFLLEHREQALVSLLTGPRPIILAGTIGGLLIILRLRTRWLRALDRRYYREPYDARQILTRFIAGLHATTLTELHDCLSKELESAFHARTSLFVSDRTTSSFNDVTRQCPSIGFRTTLVGLAFADSRPMVVELSDETSPLHRLTVGEVGWLRRGGYSLLMAVRHAGGEAAGIVAVSRKRSGLPYTDDDQKLLAAMTVAVGLALDSIRLAATPEQSDEPPARECLSCSKLTSSRLAHCQCGGELVTAAVPNVLRGVFKLQQRIGAGGMGVVYRAVDLQLERDVAVKAVPQVTPDHVARLRREARAMAAVSHSHLAVVFGVETWHDTLFLVQEYLSGGTLADRIAISRLSVREALDLGIALTDALESLHKNGIVHCDIKPSNIGFTGSGTEKLLDFGLARTLQHVRRDLETGSTTDVNAQSRFYGTPHYMSPEAARGEAANPAFDLWALNVVLFVAIAGTQPFEGSDAYEILDNLAKGSSAKDLCSCRPDASSDLAGFFRKALSQRLSDRPPDAASLKSALIGLRSAAC
jgi:hypothetical protein